MNRDVQSFVKKTQAFLRGLEATFDEFIARTISRGEELLDKDRDRPPDTEQKKTESQDVAP
jgi:hypothetical protein